MSMLLKSPPTWIATLTWATLFCGVAAAAPPSQSLDSIRDRTRQFLLEQLEPGQRKDAKIELGRLDPRLRLRQCAAPLQAFAVGRRAAIGATSVGVRCDSADHPWTLYVTARVTVYGDVLVATHALSRGDRIQAGDLHLARKDLSKLSYGYLTEPQAATGKVLKRGYLVGQVLQPNQLQAPALVKRGQQVTLHAQTGGIEVRMGGRALSDGAAGDRIRVRNSRSNRIVEGEVVAEGVVRVRI